MASLKFRRTASGVVATGLFMAGVAMLPSTPAFADPQDPATASQAEQQLTQLGHQAEVVNEQLLGAQADLDTKRAQEAEAQASLTKADAALGAAQAGQEQFRGTVDSLTAATYQGARLNRLSALMISRSPQELLDQMSGLDVLAADTAQRVQKYATASAQATAAELDARSATAAAKAASDAAALLQTDLQHKQGELLTQTTAVRAQYNSLTEAERVSFVGSTVPAGYVPPVPMPASGATVLAQSVPSQSVPSQSVPSRSAPPALAPGSSAGAAALQAALGKLGAPYVYGATGPNAFDCSGLTQWAYRQAGMAIPRTAQAQAAGGRAVSRDALQPGDLVFFYSPVSHVGIYAGGGNVVHAATEGQPVKVAPMSYMPYAGARRY